MCPGHTVPYGRLNGAPLAPVLEAMYPGARVHHGFLQSFQAVTSAAGNASTDLKRAAHQQPCACPQIVSVHHAGNCHLCTNTCLS